MPKPPFTSTSGDTGAMQTCLPTAGDVLAIVASPHDVASYVACRLAARAHGSVTGCAMSTAFLGGHGFSHEATVLSLLDAPPSTVHAHDMEPGGNGDAFVHLARHEGVHSASWAVIETDVAARLSALASWHDLIVVQRPGDTGADPIDGLNQLLLRTGLPCLVLPVVCTPSSVFDRVVLAWDGSRAATKALRAVLPLLMAAKDVLLLDGATEPASSSVPQFDPITFLARHGVEATRTLLDVAPSAAGPALLERSRRFEADLLVMGAYGHAPLRERIFGGATRHVFGHGDIATFLHH
ncbi:universal stress protein [Luteibacter flocculans]|uniref:Universal stress protein n=1 Tax=Luteibacter flocculans TaxID=2780091 RepID=A0ABY4T5C0_9GAMM|nr:universal stress protein [Luteibacter flocculans]URL60098.1 universal stress protein [Luteibacter flocculans]